MKSKINKQSIFLIILLILLIFIILGISYAFLQTSFFGSKESVLKVGNLALVLDESDGNAITVSADGPLSDSEGVNLDNYYSFKITNNGKVASSYTIYLDNQPLDDGDVRIDQEYVHYSLERDDSNNVAKSLTGNQKLESGIINSKQTINYKLRLWFSSDMTTEEENKVFKAKLRIEASQNINTMASSLKLTDEEKQTITKIVFQDKINDIENTTKSYDLSANDNNSVIGKIVSNGDSTNTLYIQSNGEIFANSNSSYLFNYFTELKTIENLNLLNTSQVINMSHMFSNCKSLLNIDLSNFDTSKVANMNGIFSMWNKTDGAASTGGLTSLNLRSFDTSKVTNMYDMFAYNKNLEELNISSFNTENVTNMAFMFTNCIKLSSIDVSNFNTSSVVYMQNMFGSCKSLTSLNLSSFDTSNVNYIKEIFYNCEKLQSIDLRKAIFTKISNYDSMFYGVPSDINIITKDVINKSWLEDRLNGKGTVTIR